MCSRSRASSQPRTTSYGSPSRRNTVVATPFEVVLAQEAVGRMCPDTVHVLSRLSMGPSQVLAELGSDHLKEKYLKRVAAGECIMPVVIPEL